MKSFAIFGACSDLDTFFSRQIVEQITRNLDDEVTLEFSTELEVDYITRLRDLTRIHGKEFYGHQGTHVILLNGNYLGDIQKLKEFANKEIGMSLDEMGNTVLLQRLSKEAMYRCLQGRETVFIEFSSAWKNELIGKIVIELSTELCPIACENFIKLCTGEAGVHSSTLAKLHYVDCPVHRIVPGGWFQCGDILDGSGANSIAAIGEDNRVQDESFTVDFGATNGGIVGFSTSTPHSIGSQFFVTFGPCPWMNQKFVGIGRVVQGFDVLRMIEQTPTKNQKPTNSIVIRSCGRGIGEFR